MKKPNPKKSKGALGAEVSPAMIGVIVGVLVLLVGGYFAFQSMQGPKVLHGNAGAVVSHNMMQEHQHVDAETGHQVTHD